jgi:hypothetical protein
MADGVVVVGGRFRGDRLGISDMRERDTNFLRKRASRLRDVTPTDYAKFNRI